MLKGCRREPRAVILSEAKNPCSCSQVVTPAGTAEILRCAQDDTRFHFYTF
jgi:hypothetical protein